MNALAEFLLARIADDEAVARTASVGSESWRVDDWTGETVLWWPPEPTEKVEHIRTVIGDDQADRAAQWRGQTIESAGDRIAPHVARWDPARVLAECEAKRRIVREHAPIDGFPACPTCTRYDEEDTTVTAPCPTLRALALPYADHEDYRQEWRP